MRVSERGEERIVTIYVDVLVALNLYVTWFLLLASEALSGRPCKRWRRGLAALAGGLSSLAIFLPELPFLPLFLIKLGLAAAITWIAGGAMGFWRRMGFFFAANFLFAGVMIALWLMAAPPRLIIRNGVVYYHIQAMTLAVSTVIAYGAARLYVLLREKTAAKDRVFSARLGYQGKEVVFRRQFSLCRGDDRPLAHGRAPKAYHPKRGGVLSHPGHDPGCFHRHRLWRRPALRPFAGENRRKGPGVFRKARVPGKRGGAKRPAGHREPFEEPWRAACGGLRPAGFGGNPAPGNA